MAKDFIRNDGTHETAEENNLLLQNLVAKFPMGCVCLQPVYTDGQEIENFIIVYINTRLETILHLSKGESIGKKVTDALCAFNPQSIRSLIRIACGAYDQAAETCEIDLRVFGRIYKASSFFISKDRVLCFMEDIHTMYFRRHYKRFIPREIVTTVIAENSARLKEKELEPEQLEEENASLCFAKEQAAQCRAIDIVKAVPDIKEPNDAMFRDSLTGLYDRCFAMEALRMYVDHQVLPLSIALCDVNGLKSINESMGYRAGDDILIKIADVLNARCRADDIVARWNDGEFILLLPNASRSDVQHIIKRLKTKLHAICEENSNIVTFGYATSDQQCRSAEDLLRDAEKWIFQKKLLISQSHRHSIIRVLLSMLHAKSTETEEHSDRMADHCRWIAQRLNLSDELLDDLILLSMLHDIGKIGIPDYILNKPGPLTEDERQIIQQHSQIGYRIAQTVPELKQVADYILMHHERWDGGGYPDAIKGDDIPLASRIIAVVDAYDVMVTGRKYRGPRTKEEAIAELQRCAGTQFDPQIVNLYVKLLMESEI